MTKPKYNKTQVNFIISKLREAIPYCRRVDQRQPTKAEQSVLDRAEAIRVKIGKSLDAEYAARNERIAKQREYIDGVEVSLMLADVEFDLPKALKALRAIK
ncbi:MAG: hypothetical protein HN683_04715 [Gammaproteobacteria bacterium]|jgi:hypothetical protein|nr:hypothetical protein [Gammaproteobacteria bacterium]